MSDKKLVGKGSTEVQLAEAGFAKRAVTRRSFLRIATGAGAAVVVSGAGLQQAFAKPPKSKIDTPILTCFSATQVSISIQVCAGATGLPAGFSLQWMTDADFVAGGSIWPSSDTICHASFSGNANLSRYSLSPGECVAVNVGDFLFDEGASTNCDGILDCGTPYVFRAFGHATSTLNRSDFTANLTCSTLSCDHPGEDGCTLTQGYWKTHNEFQPPLQPDGVTPNPLYVLWPVSGLNLGTVSYTNAQLLSIFNTPASGNGLIVLAHQLIAAKLNIANGADGTAVATAIADADTLIGGLVIAPVGTGFLAPPATSALTTALANYNEGATGPGHCE